jgi:hypothetical protein
LFTELVEKLASRDKTLCNIFKIYIWQLWDLLVDFSMPLDEIGMLDHFNGLDANGIRAPQGARAYP